MQYVSVAEIIMDMRLIKPISSYYLSVILKLSFIAKVTMIVCDPASFVVYLIRRVFYIVK